MTIKNTTTKENTNNRNFRTIIPMLSTVLFASACVEVTPENAQNMDEDSAQILTLHELDSDSILQDVIDVYGEMDSTQVTPSLDEPNNLKDVVAIAIDFDKMSDKDMMEHKDLLLDAMAEGIPFLVENAHSGHELANLIGVGVEADLAYVKAPRPGVAGLISIYDDAMITAEAEEESVMIDIESTQDEEVPEDMYENLEVTTDFMKLYAPTQWEKREKKANKLIEQVKPTASTFTNGVSLNLTYRHDLPTEHYTLIYVDFASDDWDSDIQTGTGIIDQDYVIQIFNVTDYNNGSTGDLFPSKYVSVQGVGGGFSIDGMQLNTPGSAFHNGEMGSFQDQLSVLIDIKDSSVSRYKNAPVTGNHAQTFQSTTGLDMGASGDSSGSAGISGSISHSEQVTSTRLNFEVASKLYGSNGYQFDWNMRSAEGAMYDVDNPRTLSNEWWGGLHTPAPLARGQFSAAFETVFRTNSNNNNIVTVSLTAKQRMITVQSQAHWFWQDVGYSQSIAQLSGNISINLNTSLHDIVFK